jgi:hypothetical protein
MRPVGPCITTAFEDYMDLLRNDNERKYRTTMIAESPEPMDEPVLCIANCDIKGTTHVVVPPPQMILDR